MRMHRLLVVLALLGFAGIGSSARAEDADSIRPGTALARFAARYSDSTRMPAAVLAEEHPTPAWLRAAWREAHPYDRYPANDPGHGYPHFLHEIHEWMLHHQDLRPSREEPGTEELDLAAQLDSQFIGRTVGGDLRISGEQLRPRSESDIAINTRSPNLVLAGSNNLDGFTGRLAIYSSNDGGSTWSNTLLPLVTGDDYHGDPAVGWTTDGTAWALTLGIQGTSLNRLRLQAYRSTDNGVSWTFDGTVSGSQRAADKEKLWIDTSASSAYRDTLYAIWHNNGPSYVARRTAAGWQAPIRVSGGESKGNTIGADLKTNAYGDVFALWPTSFNRRIYAARSTNGGASFGTPVAVAELYRPYTIGIPAQASRRALVTISAGAYRTATRNDVFAAWTNLSGEPGCSGGADEPGSNATSTCKTRIWFTRSTDGGLTWQPATKVEDPPSLNDQFNQALAVDETTGRIGLVYYDTRDDAGRKMAHLYYQSSSDFGQTWSAPLRVSSAATDETVTGTDFANQYGDYNGLAGFLGRFLPSWTDRRNGTREEIWTAPISDP